VIDRVFLCYKTSSGFRYIRAISQIALVIASKEIGLSANDEKTKYMVMFRDQNAGQCSNITIGNKFFERVEEFKYLEKAIKSQNSIEEEIES
jgi:hypothetical protein